MLTSKEYDATAPLAERVMFHALNAAALHIAEDLSEAANILKAHGNETFVQDPNAEVVRLLTLFHEVTDLTCEEHDCTPCRRIDEVAERALRGSVKAVAPLCNCKEGECYEPIVVAANGHRCRKSEGAKHV